jgi:hypothetical protein
MRVKEKLFGVFFCRFLLLFFCLSFFCRGFFFFFFGANCTGWLGPSTAAASWGFYFFFGATCAGCTGASAAAAKGIARREGNTDSGQQTSNADACQNLFQILSVHCIPPFLFCI